MAKVSWRFAEGDELVPGRLIVKRLGGGTRFEAFLVADELLGTTAVAKVLRPDRVTEERALTALRREARALRQLAHPYILRQFDAVTDGPRPHLLLEHVEGPTLAQLIAMGPVALEQIVPLGAQIASALHYLARAGWTHLDLKPDNVVVGVSPTIIDFSVARTTARAAALTRPVGTSAYMSPEQCDPERHGPVGPAADVWALGVTLFETLARELPFPSGASGGSTQERYPQLHLDPMPLPAERTPQPLAALIEACLRRDPTERPSPADVAEALEPMLAALPSRPTLRRRRPRLA